MPKRIYRAWNVTVLPLGERFKQAREAAGLSAAAAGALIGVHENTVYALERDAEAKALWLVRKAAAVYGITDAQMFGAAAPVVPLEYHPLMNALAPLDREARESIIRNIASNLGFMASLFAESSVRNRTEKETRNVSGSYATQQDNSGSSDEVEDFDRAAAIARKTERANAPSRSGRHAAEKTRGQGKR